MTGAHARRSRAWLLVPALVLIAAAGAVALVVTHSSSPSAAPGASPTASPGRHGFAFPPATVVVVRTEKGQSAVAAPRAAAGVASALNGFYDEAFVDPRTWTGGVPSASWNVFAQRVRPLAQRDSTSLALGRQAPSLASLGVTTSSLQVTVLLDPSGSASAAEAKVTLAAAGKLRDGTPVAVHSTASLFLTPTGSTWSITAYPDARTTVDTTGSATSQGASESP